MEFIIEVRKFIVKEAQHVIEPETLQFSFRGILSIEICEAIILRITVDNSSQEGKQSNAKQAKPHLELMVRTRRNQ